jgi:hypothetical protein
MEAFAIGLTLMTFSSANQLKNAFTTPQCVLIVKGASPATFVESMIPVISRWVTICGSC